VLWPGLPDGTQTICRFADAVFHVGESYGGTIPDAHATAGANHWLDQTFDPIVEELAKARNEAELSRGFQVVHQLCDSLTYAARAPLIYPPFHTLIYPPVSLGPPAQTHNNSRNLINVYTLTAEIRSGIKAILQAFYQLQAIRAAATIHRSPSPPISLTSDGHYFIVMR
jgi:hypothetical protein